MGMGRPTCRSIRRNTPDRVRLQPLVWDDARTCQLSLLHSKRDRGPLPKMRRYARLPHLSVRLLARPTLPGPDESHYRNLAPRHRIIASIDITP